MNALLARRCSAILCVQLVLAFVFPENTCADELSGSVVGRIYKDNIDAVVSVIAHDSNGQPISQGSGFIINSNGRVVTNQHVISDASSITVKMNSGAFYSAAGVASVDCSADLAILDLAAKGVTFSHVALSQQPEVEIGDPVVVIGTPLSLELSVSDGIVSGIRSLPDSEIRYFQTTAPVSSGNSGGPLFDTLGNVVGVVSFKLAQGENLNFAVSSRSIFAMPVNGQGNAFAAVDSYLTENDYACRSAEDLMMTRTAEHGTLSGTYAGVWQSNRGFSGVTLVTVALDGNSVSGKLSITGSPLGYTGDEFLGQVEEFADGVWTVSLRTNDKRMKATAVFSGDELIGDYSFRIGLLGLGGKDRGKWILQRR